MINVFTNGTLTALGNNTTYTSLPHTEATPTGTQTVDVLDAIYVFIFGILFGSLGNILILLVLGLNRKLWTIPNTYVASIAFSDLIITSEAFPVIFANNVNRRHVLVFAGIDDMTACKIQGAIHIISVSVSLYSIMAVAINRYLCVCMSHFYRAHIGMRFSILTNVGIWIFNIVMVAITVGFQIVKTEYNPYLTACAFRHHGSATYVYLSNIIAIYTPMVVTLVCYVLIYLAIRDTKRNVERHVNRNGQKGLSQKDLTVIRVLFFTYAAFVICWLPYSLMAFVALHRPEIVPAIAYKITVRMCMSNACVNSVVYGVFNKKFRKEYRRILCLPVEAIMQKKVFPDQSTSTSSS